MLRQAKTGRAHALRTPPQPRCATHSSAADRAHTDDRMNGVHFRKDFGLCRVIDVSRPRRQASTKSCWAGSTGRAPRFTASAPDSVTRSLISDTTQSALTVAPVVSHLRWVESHWFERSFLGRESAQRTPTAVGTSTECRWSTCARSREIVDGHQLGDLEAYAPEGIGSWGISSRRQPGILGTWIFCGAADGVRGYSRSPHLRGRLRPRAEHESNTADLRRRRTLVEESITSPHAAIRADMARTVMPSLRCSRWRR